VRKKEKGSGRLWQTGARVNKVYLPLTGAGQPAEKKNKIKKESSIEVAWSQFEYNI
jgi:hypothetical protein